MEKMSSPQELETFFAWLKKTSEQYWEVTELNRTIYGFQIQKGTKWLPGLSEPDITEYERSMGFAFPEVYKQFLKCMNGTDKSTINIYGESGEPYRYEVGFFSYPRDLEKVKAQIDWIREAFKITSEGIEQRHIPHIMPILGHRFLVMDRCEGNPVLSMYEDDVILYASSLPQLLVTEIFQEGDSTRLVASNKKIEQLLRRELPSKFKGKVKFWLE